jgi:hypothetical protein
MRASGFLTSASINSSRPSARRNRRCTRGRRALIQAVTDPAKTVTAPPAPRATFNDSPRVPMVPGWGSTTSSTRPGRGLSCSSQSSSERSSASSGSPFTSVAISTLMTVLSRSAQLRTSPTGAKHRSRREREMSPALACGACWRLGAASEFAMSRRSLACGNGTLVFAGPAGRWMGAAQAPRRVAKTELATAADDFERTGSSSSRDARSPAGTALSSSPVGRPMDGRCLGTSAV